MINQQIILYWIVNTCNESNRIIDALEAVCHSCSSKKFDDLLSIVLSVLSRTLFLPVNVCALAGNSILSCIDLDSIIQRFKYLFTVLCLLRADQLSMNYTSQKSAFN